jgi:hypothetical protein
MAVGKETKQMNIRTFFYATFLFASTVHAADKSPDITGHYFLQGAMEMGSQLLLRKDGTFAGQIVYGSEDGYAKGTWQTQADTLSLLVDTPPTVHIAEKILFNMANKRDLKEINTDVFYRPDKAQDLQLAEHNYVLNMHYGNSPEPPTLNAVDIYVEFTQGPPLQLLWRETECDGEHDCGVAQHNLSIPFDPQRTLKKIGVRMSKDAGPIQWFNVSSTGRMFEIGWKKTLGKLSFEQPDESNLAESQYFLRYFEQDVKEIKNNYFISLYYSATFTPPTIKPIDIYWHFQDGATEQQVWTDSKQALLVQPFDAKRTLQEIGFRAQGSTESIQWLDDISANDRWFYISWQDDSYGQNTDMGELFRNMTLEIKPNCLQLDLGDNKACYRK